MKLRELFIKGREDFFEDAESEWFFIEEITKKYVIYLLETHKKYDNPNNSSLLFALGITDCKPTGEVKKTKGGGLMDIDLDFGTERRHEVFEYIQRTYGEENVASIATMGKMLSKAIIRNVGMALGMPTGPGSPVDIIAKYFPDGEVDFRECVSMSPELQGYEKQYPKLFEYAEVLSGKPKSVGVHAAGTVVTPVPITTLFPMGRGRGDKTSVTQWDMYDVEAAGFVKLDLLGLNTIDVMNNTLKLIKERHGIDIDIGKVPLDDKDTLKMFAEGKTTGIFQLERGYVQKMCRDLKINSFYDVCALNALLRPGTLHSGMATEYIKRKTGEEEYKCPHPSLEDALKDTYGVLLFQETILKVVRDYAGFTMGSAELLRKGLGKKKAEIIEKMKSDFFNRAEKLNRPKDVTELLWKQIDAAKNYSFNLSHSVLYGKLTYCNAWLKTHYFKEYMTCLLNGEQNSNEPKVDIYLKELRSRKVMILPPDARVANSLFEIDGDKVRFGLTFIKNVTKRGVEELARLKDKLGSFTDLLYNASSDLNKTTMENLILAGAFDYMGKDRYFLLELYLEIAKRINKYKEYLKKVDNGVKVKKLFFLEDIRYAEENFAYTGQTMSSEEKIKAEYELCNCYITNDPMECFLKYIDGDNFYELQDLMEAFEFYRIKSRNVNTIAITRDLSITAIKNGPNIGRAMAVLEIFDTTRSCSAFIFADNYENLKDKIFNNAVYKIFGDYGPRGFVIRDLELIQKNGE